METKKLNTALFPELSYSVSGQGEAIVLLHGFPLDGSIWNKIVPALSAGYKVIVPDLPGCGGSTFSAEALSIEDMAESVKLIIDNEGLADVILTGHSMGGYVALAFAELYPAMLRGLALVHSFATADSEEKKEQRRKSIDIFKKGGKGPFIRQMIPALFSERSKKRLDTEIDNITARALLTENTSLIAFYNAMIKRPDRTAILYSNTLPLFWAIGEDDNIAVKKNLMQQTSLSNVNFVYVYSNCGHMAMIEVKEQLCDDLISFAGYCSGAVKK